MFAQIKKFAPVAAILGYLFVYSSSGKSWDRVITDLSTISVEKLKAKSQNILMIAAAGVGLYLLKKVKLPAAIKTFIIVLLYLFIGYNAGLVIDPVGCGGQYEAACTAGWVTPKARNPYAPGAK